MKHPVKKALMLLPLLAGAACGTTSCVARGTLVRTRRGLRPVEDFEVGDALVCCDPATGELVDTVVTRVARATRECVRLAGTGFELLVTSDHPLYDPAQKQWAPAGDWALGHRSALLFAGQERAEPVDVDRREPFHAVLDVFDLTVAHELHTFIASGVVVHNKLLPRYCTDADGGRQFADDPCTQPDGDAGVVSCDPNGAAPVCKPSSP